MAFNCNGADGSCGPAHPSSQYAPCDPCVRIGTSAAAPTLLHRPQAHRKPGYLEICCNLPTLCHPSFLDPPVPLPLPSPPRAAGVLDAAATAAAAALRGAARPLILVGARALRVGEGAARALLRLVETSGLPVAATADAKGLVPEAHKQLIGTYW